MSKERTLANIAETAFWVDVESENKNTFDRVAKAVEKEVLTRLKKDEEIKAGDWVRVSDESENDAQQTSTLYHVTGFTPDGRVMADGLPWKYAVHPDDVKVLPVEEYKVRIENKTPSTESFEAGQELTFVQSAQWVAKYGSTDGLQRSDMHKQEWRKDDYSKSINISFKYRVAPKKVNDPDDPTTWEKGVAMFRRDGEDDVWVLDVFIRYSNGGFYKYGSDNGVYKYAKLATPEQIEAWKLINEDL